MSDYVPKSELEDLENRMIALLDAIGNRTTCRGCGEEIWFVTTKNGKKMPISQSFVAHFSDCPASQRFRKKQ